MTRILLVALLATTFCYAQKPYDFKEAELKSRKLIYTMPDSALSIIKKTLAQKGKIHDTIYGNTYNLYGMYFGMKGRPDSSVYYFKKSLPYNADFPRNKARSLLNLAVGHRNKGEFQTSINYALEAIETNKKVNNDVGIAMNYGEIASSYNTMGDYKSAIDYLLKATTILKAKKNTQQLVSITQKLANTYLKLNNFAFAADLYLECLPIFKAQGSEKNYNGTLANLGEAYIHLKKYDAAKKVLTEAAAGFEKFGDKELIGVTLAKVGNLERQLGNNDKALRNYAKAFSYVLSSKSVNTLRIGAEYIDLLNLVKDYKKAEFIIAAVEGSGKMNLATDVDKLVYKKAVAQTYSGTNDNKKAIAAYQATIAAMEANQGNDSDKKVREIQAKFQTDLQREKNLALQANNNLLKKQDESQKSMMTLYIIISVIILIMALSFLRGYWLKNKLQTQHLKAVEAEKNLIKQQHLYEQELTNAQKEIIEEKQRELTSLALRMANYQDNLNEVIEKCDANIFTKVSDVKKELYQLTKQKDYWKQFETRFNTLHPDFNNTLVNKFSKLTKNDLEFCSLLKLNLSNKEIASLLQISHESAITKKYRIKKKMEINDDAEFEKVLMEI